MQGFAFGLPALDILPSPEPAFPVRIQIARGVATAYRKHRIGIGLPHASFQKTDIRICQDIDIVDQYRLFLSDKRQGVRQGAARIEQPPRFVRKSDFHLFPSGIFHGEPPYHIREMMQVDHEITETVTSQTLQQVFQQGSALIFHQGFGTVVGKRPEPGSQTGGKNKGYHGYKRYLRRILSNFSNAGCQDRRISSSLLPCRRRVSSSGVPASFMKKGWKNFSLSG